VPNIRKYKVTLRWPLENEIFQTLDVEAYDAADALVQAELTAELWTRYEGGFDKLKSVHPRVAGIEPARPTPPLCGKPEFA